MFEFDNIIDQKVGACNNMSNAHIYLLFFGLFAGCGQIKYNYYFSQAIKNDRLGAQNRCKNCWILEHFA
jgi:hypothetical protein